VTEVRTPAQRATRQRAAVAAALESVSDFLSAQELHELLRRRGDNVGLATVYRTMQALAEADEVDTLRTADGETLYRRCSGGHHHHLVCRSCGTAVEVAGRTVEHLTDEVAARHGFTEVSHTFEIFGYCPRCSSGR
jgi:Fur family transcriptional regulator, ferric uptake regulator